MIRRWCLVACALTWLAGHALAQQSTVIRGVVLDATGAPAAGADVLLLDRLGLRIAAALTGTGGEFAVRGVPFGTYTIVAELGSQRSRARIVAVESALPITLELRLVPGVSETVVVQTDLPSAPSVAVRTTLAGEAVRGTPGRLRNRGVQQALATLPGWASEDNGLLHVRGVDDGFLYVEDGIPVYDRIDSTFGIAPDPAGIGSMQVLTGYIPPEFGLKSGAVIEVQSSMVEHPGWLADVDFGAGSERDRSVRSSAGGPIGSRASLGVSAGAERSDRFLDPVHPDNFHNRGGVISGDARLALVVSSSDLVRAKAGAGRSRYDVPHGEDQEEAGQDQRQHLMQHAQSASWQRSWGDSVASQVAVYRRSIDAVLEGSPADTPITASSDRRHQRTGVLGSVTYLRGRHTMKAGAEVARVSIAEDFAFAVTDEDEAEEAGISEAAEEFTRDDPFEFSDSVARGQWSLFAQDTFRASSRLTIDFGIRVDRTNLLVSATGWSPRAGAAFVVRPGTTVRGSMNRLFQPPQPEHLLLSSSVEARALSPFEGGGLDLEPERQTAFEVGVEQWLGGRVRLDGAAWRRNVTNYADPNVFFGTTIVFPNSVASGHASGFDLRLEVPGYLGWSGYASYAHARVEQVGPINGGLFLEEEVTEIGPGTRFTPDHDQRHVASAGLTYSRVAGFAASFTTRYESGTPLEVDDDELDELLARPGSERVDFETGRVRPRLLLDAVVSQRVWKGPKADAHLRLTILNLTGREYALNFSNPFSGTHFGAPRTLLAEVRVGFN